MIFLGVRPSITHIIGISGLAKQSFQQEIDVFMNEKYEEDFLDVSKNVWNSIEYGDEIVDDYKKSSTFDVFYHFDSRLDLFGMLPVFHFNESHLYNHSLIWCLLESGMLKSEPKSVALPYDDMSEFKAKELSVLKENIKDRQLLRELQIYDGNWARKYPGYNLDYFDDDFDFALKMFHELGIMIKHSDLNRYLVFEWS